MGEDKNGLGPAVHLACLAVVGECDNSKTMVKRAHYFPLNDAPFAAYWLDGQH